MQSSLFKKINYIILTLTLATLSVANAQEVRVIDNKGTIQQIRNNQVTVSNTAPSDPLEGDVWYDSTTSPIIVKIWDEPSGQWEEVPGLNNFWSLTGNSGINPANNFLGTTDNQDLIFKTNDIEAMRIDEANQNIGIGTQNPERTLHIAGDNAGVRLDRYGSDAFFFFVNFNALGTTVLQNWGFTNLSSDNSFEIRNYGTNLGGSAPTSLKITSNNQMRLPSYGTPTTFDASSVSKLLGVQNDGSVVQILPNELPTPLTTFTQNDTPTSTDPAATGEITYQDEEGDPFTAQIVSANANNTIEVGTDGGAYLGPTVYTGSFIINNNGDEIVTGLPFRPSQITFVAHANVETFGIDDDNDSGNNNNNGIPNTFGSMNGFARSNTAGTITQGVIYVGGSGNSINDISRYSSNARCIGVRYGNQNGDAVGRTLATLTSFDTNGFTVNVTNRDDNLLVFFTAYK